MEKYAEDLAREYELGKTDEDLFKLVEENGFINPDAFTELNARGLYNKYQDWKKNT